MSELRLFNTLTGRVEPFVPQSPPDVGMYVCGLTVYNRGHIGNYRSLVASDLLRRTLRYKGYRVKEVVNITDVDDRIIQQAQAAGKTLADFTAEYIRAFEEDMARLGMERPEVMPKATDHIPEMVDLVSRLTARGHTYTAEGSVYFRIGTFPGYGKLSRLDVGGIQAGARVDTDKYDKENARDFVLWKAKEDEPAWAHWDAPFGRGRPGWHIECSAMSMKYLGETFDLHCGGEDLIFPHHENEIAQSEAGTGKPFVRHWVHVKHLMVDNETMSKSKGNFFLIPELLERGHSAEAIRYLLASSHYRKPLNFTFEALTGAAGGLDRIRRALEGLEAQEKEGTEGPAHRDIVTAVEARTREFDEALSDDLNTPEALAAVHGLVNDAFHQITAGGMTREGARLLRDALGRMDTVFGVFVPRSVEERLAPDEQALFDERQEARRARDFARADAARARLEGMGIVLEDTPKGTVWRRKR
jgi:cysteinyl-tRNA synthetase